MAYSIGQFAALAGVTAKTLRFYDEIGLLSPETIDVRTRYRRYAPEQLRRLATILSLRELGHPLSEIRELLRRGAPAGGRRRALERAREQLAASLAVTQSTLAWVDAELAEVAAAREATPVVVRRSPAFPIASLRAHLERYSEIEELERALHAAVPERLRGLRSGVIWHRCAAAGAPDGEAFVELKAPLPFRAAARSRIEVKEMPAATLASVYTDGNDAAAESAYATLHRWAQVRSYRVEGAARELYHSPMLEVQLCVEPEIDLG